MISTIWCYQIRVTELRHGRISAQELRHQFRKISLTPAQINFGKRNPFAWNSVPKLILRAEVHRLVPKLFLAEVTRAEHRLPHQIDGFPSKMTIQA